VPRRAARSKANASCDSQVGSLTIERWAACKHLFKNQTKAIERGVKAELPDLPVDVVDTQGVKPNNRTFVVTGPNGETFVELRNMEQPYRPLRDLDVDKVTQDIIRKLTQRKN